MRLRFTIRDLLWLTVVAAMAVGWWLDHRHISQQFNYCYEELLATEDQLEQTRMEMQNKVNALRAESSAAKTEAQQWKQDAQVFRPGSVPPSMLPPH